MSAKKLWHMLFVVGIFFKGLDGVTETAGGLAFVLLKHSRIIKYTLMVVSGELKEDPNDLIANFLVHLAATTPSATELFAGVFLLVHGMVKIAIVTGLFMRKLWVYPVGEVVLGLFVGYQVYRYARTLSWLLLGVTVVDLFVLFLIWTEYRRLKGLGGMDAITGDREG